MSLLVGRLSISSCSLVHSQELQSSQQTETQLEDHDDAADAIFMSFILLGIWQLRAFVQQLVSFPLGATWNFCISFFKFLKKCIEFIEVKLVNEIMFQVYKKKKVEKRKQ